MNGTIKEKIYTFYNTPCLYDKEEKNYNHGDIKKKKKRTWTEIGEKLEIKGKATKVIWGNFSKKAF